MNIIGLHVNAATVKYLSMIFHRKDSVLHNKPP